MSFNKEGRNGKEGKRNTSGVGNGYRTVVKIPDRKKKQDRHRHKRH